MQPVHWGIIGTVIYGLGWALVATGKAYGVYLLGDCYILDCASLALLLPALYFALSLPNAWVDALPSPLPMALTILSQVALYFFLAYGLALWLRKRKTPPLRNDR